MIDIIMFLRLVPFFSACGVIFVTLALFKHDQDKKLSAAPSVYSLSEILEADGLCKIYKALIRGFASFVACIFGFTFKNTNIWFIISWFLFCLGIGLALEGQLFFAKKNDFLTRYVNTAAGTVSGAAADMSGSSHRSKFRNIINYNVGGTLYTYNCKETVTSDALIPIGTMVIVHYNSLDPRDSFIDQEIKKTPKYLWALLPIGALISLIGVLMVVTTFM